MNRLGVTLIIIANTTIAAPVVIHDNGQTMPVAPYLESVTIKRSSVNRPDLGSVFPQQPSAGFDRAALLPIRTPEMTPGALNRTPMTPALRQYLAKLDRPIFLIGSDSRSLQWLVRYRDQLQALGAVGMLVHAETRADLAAVDEIGRDVVIALASASMLAKLLGLRHYPVLISREGIEQ